MHKKILSVFLTFALFALTLPLPIPAQQQSKPAPAPQEQQKKDKKKGGIWNRIKEGADKTGKGIVKGAKKASDILSNPNSPDPVTLLLGKLFNDQLPLKLDASTVYKEVPTPVNFKPIFIQPTTRNLNKQLQPGDYSFPIHAICTKDSVHVPGRGVGYKLAPLQGKQANALAALISRGDIAQVPHNTLQMIAWEIQASFSYGEMPKEHQAIIDKLIPEYRASLKGDFLQRLTDGYEKYVREHPNSPASAFAENIRSINRSRTIIREENFNYQRAQQRLYNPELGERVTPADPSQPSTWTEMQPGVYTQIVIQDGWQGLNRLNVRITREAGKAPATAGIQAPAFLRTSHAPTQISFITIAGLFGLEVAEAAGVGVEAGEAIAVGTRAGTAAALRYGARLGLIAYSLAKATQALIISLSVQGGDGGGEPKEGKPAKQKEASDIAQKAKETVGNDGVDASSKDVADKAAKEFLGPDAEPMYDRNTGKTVGWRSADKTREVRDTSASKPNPYINLINKTTGGNLHVRW